MSHKINDALLLPWGPQNKIVRVVAVTEDGRAVYKHPDFNFGVESGPAALTNVGRFERVLWFWWRHVPREAKA